MEYSRKKKKNSFASKYEPTVPWACKKIQIFVVIFRCYVHFLSSGHLLFSLGYFLSLHHPFSHTYGSDTLKPGNSFWGAFQVIQSGLVCRRRSKSPYFFFVLLFELSLTQNLLPGMCADVWRIQLFLAENCFLSCFVLKWSAWVGDLLSDTFEWSTAAFNLHHAVPPPDGCLEKSS